MGETPARICIVDLECTCSDVHNGDEAIPPGEMETIEIGAVMVDGATFAELDAFEQFVRPVLHPELTDFCTRLTSITQDDVDDADDFIRVFRRFLAWMRESDVAAWGSWGRFDATQLGRDAALHGIEDELLGLPPHVNVKSVWRKRMGRGPVGLHEAVAEAGLEWQGRAHRGIDDARMVARLLPTIGWSGDQRPGT